MEDAQPEPSSSTADERVELSRESLLKLLAYLEGEVEARDIVIQTLKSEKARLLLHDARYGVARNDPFRALRDDALAQGETFDDSAVATAFHTHFAHIERLIRAHKKSHQRQKMVLSVTEKTHRRAMEQLEFERERASREAAQGDDVAARVERHRAKLAEQLEHELGEKEKLKEEMRKGEARLEQERQRHKAIVLFLVNERKQMLLKMHELRVKSEANVSAPTEEALVAELKKELTVLRQERDALRSTTQSLQMENVALREALRTADTRRTTAGYAGAAPFPTDDRSLVVSNRAATSRLPSSSSFPAEKSRVPQPTRPVPSSSRPPSTLGSSPPPLPLFSRSSSVLSDETHFDYDEWTGDDETKDNEEGARTRDRAARSGDPLDGQFCPQGCVLSLSSNVFLAAGSAVKRSSSLPRGSSEQPSPAQSASNPNKVPEKVENRTSVQPSTPQNGKGKTAGTVKRNGLFKALGVASRSDK